MEVLSKDYANFHVVTPPEQSPNQSPLSLSPSPEQRHSPRGPSLEQSLHIIVEPQMDGHTNFIHLINPPTGQILSSFLAEHGSHIEIQPGVYFRVPFPHEHGYQYPAVPPMQQPQAYPSHYPGNAVPSHATNDTLHVHTGHMVIPTQQYNPSCPIHGSPVSSNGQQSGDERLDKRREKLQKKLREKNDQMKCTCFKYQNEPQHQSSDAIDGGMVDTHCQSSSTVVTEDSNHESDEEITLCVPPKACASSPYAIIISWDECISNNSHLLKCEFDLQISNKGHNFKSIYSGQETQYTAIGLSPDTEYNFRVCALLNGKCGPFSKTVLCRTHCTVPDKPLPPRIIQKTKNALTLKWTTPLDGGSPITYYKLQWSRNLDYSHFDDLFVGLQKQYKHIHKLPPGTPCLYRLQAGNELGASDFSQILECLTSAGPPAPPDKPELLQCSFNMIKLQWNEPENNGSPVTEYKLEMEDPTDGYGFIVQYCGAARSYCCTKLLRNTSYKFRVLATNDQGSSKHSTPIVVTTYPEAPGKMEKPKLNGKIRTHTIPVKWEPPKDTGGDQIIGYILEIDDGKGGLFQKIYHGSDREFMIDQRKPGHSYRLRVASESKAGIGPWSPIATMTTVPVCPRDLLPPRLSKNAQPEMKNLYIEWDPPLDKGGAAISNYVVQMAHSPKQEFCKVYNGAKQSCHIPNLLPGTDYFFKLQCFNSAGASPWSPISTLRTAPGPPDSPLPPLVSFKSPTHIRLDWNEPVLHGSEVTGYCVEKLEQETFHKIYQGTCLFCEIKRNIEPANVYYFRIQALSKAGNSPYSHICTVQTPPAPPCSVTDIKVIEQTSNSCLVQWKHPVDNGSPIYEYVVEATGTTSLICTVPCPKLSPVRENTSMESTHTDKSLEDDDSDVDSVVESDNEIVTVGTDSFTGSETSSSVASAMRDDTMEYRLTGLTADASYKLRLQAVNQCGAGVFSHPIQFFTKELPPLPPSLNSSAVSYHSLKLKWGDSSSSKRSLAVLNHTLQIQNKSGSFTSIYSGIGTSFTVSKLKELTPYCCRIRSKNDAGEGEFSKPKIFYTKAQPPSAVRDLKTKNIKQSSVDLSWSRCDKLREDDVIEYVVQQMHQDHSKDFLQVYCGTDSHHIVTGLKPDQNYQFRVNAVRTLSENIRLSAPYGVKEIKGVFSPVVRVRTLSEVTIVESDAKNAIKVPDGEECKQRRLTDTHIALAILGTFLVLCMLIAIVLRGVLGGY
ncbi:fibronectin type-III domain-containing protein 3A-like isoform X1 [Hydractinia symbiolongicarpus]|uniref:fibronectin type-III domain-containing protein 3A-like isoform X1 n=1 Tax=Hydractinia symbiolongicarpus TaxID=13093 RepID=UPI002549F824|nr:fibronectin type-III domain-containing protein 3A-like isoform X1 [Hydractinia symbiolongicarpus]